MRLPAFTAELALSSPRGHYRSTASIERQAPSVAAAKLPSPIAWDPLAPGSSVARDPLYPNVHMDLIRIPGTDFANIFVRGENFSPAVPVRIDVYGIDAFPLQHGTGTSAPLAHCRGTGHSTMCYYDPGGRFTQCMGQANCRENNPGNIRVVVKDQSDGSEYESHFVRSCRDARPGDPTDCKL